MQEHQAVKQQKASEPPRFEETRKTEDKTSKRPPRYFDAFLDDSDGPQICRGID